MHFPRKLTILAEPRGRELPARRRCYAVSAKGVYLSAYLVVFAANKAHARRLALAKLRMDEPGISDPEIYKIEAITESGAHVLWNGDY